MKNWETYGPRVSPGKDSTKKQICGNLAAAVPGTQVAGQPTQFRRCHGGQRV